MNNKSYKDIEFLQRQIRELEDKVAQLRLSRRVLMNLVERQERERVRYWSRLEKENQKLHRDNYKYVKWLWLKNRRIVELENKLNSYDSESSAK